MAELLLEILSEEIPARMQARAAEDLRALVEAKLKDAGLAFTSARSFATPRRLALVVDGLPERQPDTVEEKKGPRTDAPPQAIQGFLKSAGLASVDECEVREVGKAKVYFHTVKRAGRATGEVLASLVGEAVAALPWPKSMRWGAGSARWVRPFSSILCLFAGKPVSGAALGVPFGASTAGHRFLSGSSFDVRDFADYQAKLHAAKVILDPAERRAEIARRAAALAAKAGLTVKDDKGLLDEVTGLVEWPVVLMGRIDAPFMALPPEVLTASMRAHQKYFSLLDAKGALAPHFLLVANMEAADGGAAIVAGNERVLRARLSDAKFFWDQDRRTRLEDRVPALSKIVFHAKLGTLGQRVERLAALAADLCEHVPGADRDQVRSAAVLAKADLNSGMVGEFPELQGAMGRYYALAEGERADVADAIAEHYAPRGPEDRCPTAPVSVAVALAEKLDTLVGFFAIDEKPTGSKDPFALRRAALGVIRLVLENKLRLPLRAVFARAQALLGKGDAQVPDALMAFFADRLKVHLREAGTRHDLVTAVFALGGEDDLVRLLARVDALGRFVAMDDGANLLVAYRRAANIVAIEEKKDKARHDGAVDAALLSQPEEKSLHAALDEAGRAFGGALAKEDFPAAMSAMARLRAPVDAFFDKVTVNAPEAPLRANRLRLLFQIRATMNRVADFSKLEG
ncbi:MAG: glycine--tRNA ligase subunit beta [Alphaproteobacteria bacterium]|nr:glycine--tRNA ligase subunit beta [Alphaproteobacteria bacterium]